MTDTQDQHKGPNQVEDPPFRVLLRDVEDTECPTPKNRKMIPSKLS